MKNKLFDIETVWVCDKCRQEFDDKKEAIQHELNCKDIKIKTRNEMLSELIISFFILVLIYIVSVIWNSLFLKEGTTTFGYLVYFIGGIYLFIISINNLFSWIKKLILFIKFCKSSNKDIPFIVDGIQKIKEMSNGKEKEKLMKEILLKLREIYNKQ